MIFRERFTGETDAALVALVAQGEEGAFRELLNRHQGAVYGFARRFLRDAQEAEDIAQEVFLRLYRTAARYRSRASLRAYLFRIAKNLCIDALRKKRPEPMSELPETPAAEDLFEKFSHSAAARCGVRPAGQSARSHPVAPRPGNELPGDL
jgi:RNA polymerase sigma-70 factor (ECF subfamily)